MPPPLGKAPGGYDARQVNVTGSGPAGPVAQAAASAEHRMGDGGFGPHGLLLLASQSACDPKHKVPPPLGTPFVTLGWSSV
jgi:hypothetical protein